MKDVPKFMQEVIFIENAGLQLKIVNFLFHEVYSIRLYMD